MDTSDTCRLEAYKDCLFLQQDIILGKRVTKGGSAFIPTLKGGVFPLRPLHPRKINPDITIIFWQPVGKDARKPVPERVTRR